MTKEKTVVANEGDRVNESVTEAKTKDETANQEDSIYTVEELAENSTYLFSVRAECVVAALKDASIKECTVSKADEVIKSFMRKEIK